MSNFLVYKAWYIGYEDPDFASAGAGPTDTLNKLGIADQVATKSKLMLGPGAAGITTGGGIISTQKRLESRDIDIAMLYLSDMLPNKDKIDIVGVLPRKICTPTAIVGFISTNASDPAGAKALLEYLASPEAQAIWKEAGFGPPQS